MGKKVVVAAIVVLILWFVMDMGVHGLVLKQSYRATAKLWRDPMLPHVLYLAKLCVALVFAHLYSLLVKDKCTKTALEYGLWFGVATGISMGYGSFAVLPITTGMAFMWFVGTTLEFVVAGLVVGAIVKDEPAGQQEPQAEPPQEADAPEQTPAEAEQAEASEGEGDAEGET